MCAATLLLALAGTTSASAASNFCVGADPTNLCPDDWPQATDLVDVQTQAADPEMNTIYVMPGTYTSPDGVNFLNKPVKILGVGATKPIITIDSAPSYAPGTSVITTANSNTNFDNLQIDMPASTGLTGITAALGGQLITNITINGPGADDSKGIVVSDASPRVRSLTINLGSGTSSAVVVDSSTSAIIDDVNVTHATNAVSLTSALNFKIRRMKSHSANGVVGLASSGTVSSSVIMPSSDAAENSGGKAVGASSTSGETNEVRVDNCTLIGGGSGTTGVAANASGLTTTQSVMVNSSIISGFEVAAGAAGAGASTELSYSRYNGATTGAATVPNGSQLAESGMGFVNAAGGDFRLTLASALVDAGDPAQPNSNDSGTDANDQSRVVSRGAGLIRDIGAFEVQNSIPVPRIQIVTSVPSTTSRTTFSAAGSTDAEGDAMTYDWKFDGAPGVSEVTTQKMFILEGPHSVQMTVTDKTGAAASTSMQFNVQLGFLQIKLRSQNATISKKGTFRITMSCPAAAVSKCSGRLLFQTTKKVNAKAYTERPGWVAAKPAYLQAARYVFSVEPGTTQKLEVRTYSTFQNVLGVHKKFELQSRLISGTTSNAKLTANRATFTISAPKSKKKN
ncbi:MAG: PKD domain-containing protein [Solirubrobacterales bacterium]